jgi:uncharacterized protein YndB with AHSA1/START domain
MGNGQPGKAVDVPSRVLVALRVKASPERAFEVFTREIALWWRPSLLFQFMPRQDGVLAFEPGLGGRLTETYHDGRIFEIGRIIAWEPPRQLVFTWRQSTFLPGQQTEVHVVFEAVGGDTRVSIEHLGWDTVPQQHVARHRFPDSIFLLRHAEWWQSLLASYARRLTIQKPDVATQGD